MFKVTYDIDLICLTVCTLQVPDTPGCESADIGKVYTAYIKQL